MWAPNDCAPSSGAEYVIATSAIVLTALQSAGSTLPGLGVAAGIALRIVTLVQNVKDNDVVFVDLANDACGLVYTLVVECRRMMNNRQKIPDHIQQHIRTLSGNLVSIENFTKKKLKRNALKKMMSQSKDVADIARYREMLRQSLNIYGIQSNISIQEYLQQLMDQLQRQRAEMEAERRRRIEEEKRAKEEQASQTEIHRIQEEDRTELEAEQARENRRRIARLKQSQADELRLIQEENARLELEQQALQRRMGRTPSPLRPLPQNYLPPSFPSPMLSMNSYPYSYPAHLVAPQPLYLKPQGGISLQNVSGSNISINSTPPPASPPMVNYFNSGNISNVSISNVNNTNTKPRRKAKT